MRDFLDYASKMYYEGNPVISDAEFDLLSSHFHYRTVGYQVTDGIEHYYPMFSLRKYFDLSEADLDLEKCIVTPKLDGAAVSVLYVGGELALALTRGDGKLGRDITDKIASLVPTQIPIDGVRQVNGEVVAPASIPNARNYAAGALNLKNMEEFLERDLTFVAYDVIEPLFDKYLLDQAGLATFGFNVIVQFNPRKSPSWPTDGEVYRLNDHEEFKALGYTSHHPRGAFALKERNHGVITTLLDVIWQVGKSGIVSPVAILDPIKIGDATVSRATLHNIEYIKNLDLEIGCQVEVIRSGEIIPRIVRRIDLEKNSS